MLQMSSKIKELILDGVYYAQLDYAGQDWLIGSTNPEWREDLEKMDFNQANKNPEKLADKDIWVHQIQTPAPLALMCGGLGAAWPGMGRQLYDNFPVCRQAMDRLAALADWDLLSIMDESSSDEINQTRKQIPYLFMLEFAQWHQFKALGLKPSLICGHSLGELVALCLAGVYSPEAAWHLLDTRAEHMASLESKKTLSGGMLAISADFSVIEETINTWPQLFIANRNTSHQYILSGPLEPLMLARKALRRRKIPAIKLNMDLAFHNPAMRVLRDLSVRRLNALLMRPPSIPILSCVTAGLYPSTQNEICEYIANLDENTVDWPATLNTMITDYKISAFLELGPRETLCSLVTENSASALCIPASRKDQEAEAMREACARLYALGYLDQKLIESQIIKRRTSALGKPRFLKEKQKEVRPVAPGPEVSVILEILSEIAQIPEDQIRLDMNLRYDLALRSSRFPYLVQEAELKLNKKIILENLLDVVTVEDLIIKITDQQNINILTKKQNAVDLPLFFPVAPLERLEWDNSKKQYCHRSFTNIENIINPGDVFVLWIFDYDILKPLILSLAALDAQIIIPKNIIHLSKSSEYSSATLIEIERDALLDIKTFGRIKCIILDSAILKKYDNIPPDLWEYIEWINSISPEWTCIIQHFTATDYEKYLQQIFFKITHELKVHSYKIIFFLDNNDVSKKEIPGIGDLFILELLNFDCQNILWKEAPVNARQADRYCISNRIYNLVYPDENALYEGINYFKGKCQFSRYKDDNLNSHGGGAYSPLIFSQKLFSESPWLPISYILRPLLDAGRILLPWLIPAGFSDLNFINFISMPSGVTRECAVSGYARPWMLQEKVFTRMCRVELSCRAIYDNGRAKNIYEPVCKGLCLLVNNQQAIQPIWQKGIFNQCGDQKKIDLFYETLNIGKTWRYIKEIVECSDDNTKEWLAVLTLNSSSIANYEDWEYSFFLQLLDGIFQTSLAIIALQDDKISSEFVINNLSAWRLATVGYIRFSKHDFLEKSDIAINMRESWHDHRILRFDAQATTLTGNPLLTVHHLEFDKITMIK